ncbi:MAG TPA: hypothetical protein VNA89_02420, partial [Gemmatimonadaceae bacterium]|nr:hypothetical protein [Gemmatimonadaceae bacterium]
SAGTISRNDALLSGVVNLVSTQKLVSEEVASADPDYIESTHTQFETTDPVHNPCRNETPVLVGKMRVHSRLVFDGLTLKYRLRSWKNTKDVYAEATTYEDHDNDPLTPAEAKKVLYVNQSRELDEFDVGPAGLPFESDQESRIHLVRTREAAGVLATDPGDDLFVYARQRVRVNESGVTHEKIEFRTECK